VLGINWIYTTAESEFLFTCVSLILVNPQGNTSGNRVKSEPPRRRDTWQRGPFPLDKHGATSSIVRLGQEAVVCVLPYCS
jgi:hypothetical protein